MNDARSRIERYALVAQAAEDVPREGHRSLAMIEPEPADLDSTRLDALRAAVARLRNLQRPT